MNNCACPHPASVHAPHDLLNAGRCLDPYCDCVGAPDPHAQLRADLAEAVAIVTRVLSNPMKRDTEDQARNIIQAVIGNFELVRRI